MSKKDGNTTEIKAVAEVRMGNYVARFTEKDLEELKDVVDHIKDGFRDNILKYQDYIISTYAETTKENSGKIVELLSSLHGYIDFFKCIGEIDIKYERDSKV